MCLNTLGIEVKNTISLSGEQYANAESTANYIISGGIRPWHCSEKEKDGKFCERFRWKVFSLVI